jgi:hypothetical protein
MSSRLANARGEDRPLKPEESFLRPVARLSIAAMLFVAVAGGRLLTVFSLVRLGVALARGGVTSPIGGRIGAFRTAARPIPAVGLIRGLGRRRWVRRRSRVWLRSRR